MSKNEINESLLELYAVVTDCQHLTPQKLRNKIRKNNEKSSRNAEVEQILANYANTGGLMAIPYDVTEEEIQAAFKRYENNTIFRLVRTGHGGGDMCDIGHGQSITGAARPKVLELLKSGEPLKRNLKQLSWSAEVNKIFLSISQSSH